MAVGGADQESRFTLALIAPALEDLGELDRRQGLAAFVERDRRAIGRRVGEFAAAVRQLGQLGRPADPLEIAVDEISFGRSADLAASDDVKEQLGPYCAVSPDRNGQVITDWNPS